MPDESEWITKRCAADATSASLRRADLTSRFLPGVERRDCRACEVCQRQRDSGSQLSGVIRDRGAREENRKQKGHKKIPPALARNRRVGKGRAERKSHISFRNSRPTFGGPLMPPFRYPSMLDYRMLLERLLPSAGMAGQ